MKNRWILLGSILAVLLVALAAGLTWAQGPEPPGEGVQPQGDVGIEAAVGDSIPIQGRLTDASGNPLNGNYNITASIYNASSGGTALCSKTQSVSVSNGLFNMTIDNCTSNHINGQQLYLGIKVGSDAEMTPRQPIYPVPYAWSLRPGAVIEDSASSTLLQVINHNGAALRGVSENSSGVYGRSNSAGLYPGVYGEGTASGGVGVYGVAPSYGVWGWATATTGGVHGVYGKTDGDWNWASGVYGEADKAHAQGVTGWNTGAGVGVYGYSENGIAIKAAGTGIIQSTADSYVFVPGGEAQLAGAPTDASLRYWARGTVDVLLSSGSNITRTVIFPVSLPAVLYGQPVRVAGIRVYYKTTNSATYISGSNLYREKPDGSYYTLISDPTNRTSTTFTSYYISCSEAECRLSDDEGFITVALDVYFADSSQYINLGGVRVTLEHD